MERSTSPGVSVTNNVQASQRSLGCSAFRDGQSWAPLVAQNVQAYTTIRIDVWVIDTGRKVDFWWLERIVGGEMYG